MPTTTLQILSTVREDATVTVSLERTELRPPDTNEVLVRMEAAPINPSDLGNMFAGADLSSVSVTTGGTGVSAMLSHAAIHTAAARVGDSLPMGNEGAGIVIEAGTSEAAQALLGKTVALRTGSYAQYRCIAAEHCLVLPDGTTPQDAASCFVNPLTALGMVETMRLEGHTALVHTAAASNLGQMLQKICTADGVSLVNIVRTPAQAQLLREIGATHVCDSSAATFSNDLTDALAQTGATIGFDATGGGGLASQILTAMEATLNRGAGYSRYGSSVHKQVYLYGSLQLGATELNRSYGMAWGVGGWLLTNFLRRVGSEPAQALMQRVANEVKTTFSSRYTNIVSLAEALSIDAIGEYNQKATGKKYLIAPHKE